MTHPVPAAIQAMLVLLRAEPELAGDQVLIDHGPPRQRRDVPDAIGVGVAAVEIPAATGATTLGLGQREDVFEIVCAIDSATGDSDVDAALAGREARAYELLGLLEDLLERHRNLGGAVMTAVLTRHSYQPRRDDEGTGALIEAVVQIHAFRPRR